MRRFAWDALSMIARSLVTALSASAGFFGVGCLKSAHGIVGGGLIVDSRVYTYASAVANSCLLPMFLLGLISLTLYRLFSKSPQGESRFLSLAPFCWALLGAAIFWPTEVWDSKSIALASGGALVSILAFGLLFSLDRTTIFDYPKPSAIWYASALIAGAVFFGALHGWTDDSPVVSFLLRYRGSAWKTGKDAPRLKGDTEVAPRDYW